MRSKLAFSSQKIPHKKPKTLFSFFLDDIFEKQFADVCQLPFVVHEIFVCEKSKQVVSEAVQVRARSVMMNQEIVFELEVEVPLQQQQFPHIQFLCLNLEGFQPVKIVSRLNVFGMHCCPESKVNEKKVLQFFLVEFAQPTVDFRQVDELAQSFPFNELGQKRSPEESAELRLEMPDHVVENELDRPVVHLRGGRQLLRKAERLLLLVCRVE